MRFLLIENNLEKLLLYLMILSMATYPMPILRLSVGGAALPYGAFMIPILLSLVIMRCLHSSSLKLNKTLLISIVLLYFSIFFSNAFSLHLEVTKVLKLLAFLMIPILFTIHLKDRKSIKTCMFLFVFIGIILCVYGYYGYFTGNVGTEAHQNWWLSYARYFGIHYLPSTRNSDIYYIAIPLIISVVLLTYGNIKRKSVKLILIILSILFFFGILLSFSRGAWIALLSTALIFFLWYRKCISTGERPRFMQVKILIIVLILLVTGAEALSYLNMEHYFFGKVLSIFSTENVGDYLKESSSNKERVNILKATFDIVYKHPLGVGTGNLKYHYPYYGLHSQHPENNYLEVLAENGIVGFLGWILFLFYPLVILYRKLMRGSKDWMEICVFFLMVYLLISYLFNVEFFSFYLWIVTSIIWCLVTLNEKNVPKWVNLTNK